MAGISAEGDDTFHLDLIIGESVWSELMFLLIEFEELIVAVCSPLNDDFAFDGTNKLPLSSIFINADGSLFMRSAELSFSCPSPSLRTEFPVRFQTCLNLSHLRSNEMSVRNYLKHGTFLEPRTQSL